MWDSGNPRIEHPDRVLPEWQTAKMADVNMADCQNGRGQNGRPPEWQTVNMAGPEWQGGPEGKPKWGKLISDRRLRDFDPLSVRVHRGWPRRAKSPGRCISPRPFSVPRRVAFPRNGETAGKVHKSAIVHSHPRLAVENRRETPFSGRMWSRLCQLARYYVH